MHSDAVPYLEMPCFRRPTLGDACLYLKVHFLILVDAYLQLSMPNPCLGMPDPYFNSVLAKAG